MIKPKNSTIVSRRNFLKNAAIATAALSAGCTSNHAIKQNKLIKPNHTILFQGDSITDAGRDRKRQDTPNDPRALGQGYAFLTAAAIMKNRPNDNLKFYNRGKSGDKVWQLRDRWQTECFDLKPDVLTILIGINDIWHQKKHGSEHETGTPENFKNVYENLIANTRKKLPQTKIILAQPFAIPGGAIKDDWLPMLAQYQHITENVTKKFNTGYIPLQKIFDSACKNAPKNYYSPDGVHPSIAGTALMAQAWSEHLKEA
jgi:lysophospholipase L1-like esterase